MALYEHVYMARQDVTAQQVETLTDGFKATVEGLGGSFAKVEYWGVKSLAYRIKKNRKAHFTLLNIEAPPAAIAEMERQHGPQRGHSSLHHDPGRSARGWPLGDDAQTRR